jgi:glycosyltransferase involved in cell wall biosynthesis
VSAERSSRLAGTVVLAVPDFEPSVGGTNRHAALLARGLAARGHDVVVVTRRRQRSWPKEEVLGSVRVRRIGFPGRGTIAERHAPLALALWLASRRAHIGAVSALMWPDSALAIGSAGLLERAVVIWAIRGEIDAALSPRGSIVRRGLVRLRRAAVRRCRHIVLTNSMATEFARVEPRARVSIVPVPVDLGEFRVASSAERNAARDQCGLDAEFAVVYVGHLESRKAVDRLIKAVKMLTEEGRSVRLLLVGGGRKGAEDTERELRAQVAAGGLEGIVEFRGVTSDPRPYLWAADAFVLPSFREGMPNSLLEAMACGAPCVAPRSAGGDELLDEGAGLIPDSNEPAALADAIGRLVDDPALRASIAATARERLRRFGVDVVAEQFERVCAEVARR